MVMVSSTDHHPVENIVGQCQYFFRTSSATYNTHITLPSKLVVLGDFNVHVDRNDNADARKCVDLLSSLNLEQHVHCPTHKHGHTLDLVILRATDAFGSLSDHFQAAYEDACSNEKTC